MSEKDLVLEAQLMVDEARRSIDAQRGDLNSTRTRVAALLGVSGVAFPLSSSLSTSESNPAWGVLALVALILAIAYSAYVLWPRTFTFEMSTEELMEAQDPNSSTEHYLRSVAASLGSYRRTNVPMISKLTGAYMAAAVFVGLEVIALSLRVVLG